MALGVDPNKKQSCHATYKKTVQNNYKNLAQMQAEQKNKGVAPISCHINANTPFPMVAYFVKKLEDVPRYTCENPQVINELAKSEGLSQKIYKDPAGIKTSGVGHNTEKRPLSNYGLGKRLTKDQMYALFAKDILDAKHDRDSVFVGTNLNQGQKEAMLDLFYNVGVERLSISPLIGTIKSGKTNEATKQMNFVRAAGKINGGLCIRRLKNMRDYNRETPSREDLITMRYYIDSWTAQLNKKIENAKNSSAKNKAIREKNFFVSQSKKIINDASYNLLLSKKKTPSFKIN